MKEIARFKNESYVDMQVRQAKGENADYVVTLEEGAAQYAANDRYLKEKYGYTSCYNKEDVDYMGAVFDTRNKTYLILTIIMFMASIAFGKVLFPQLAEMFLNANRQMADLATIRTQEIVQEKKDKKEWF